ncbi:MAG TPA: pilus assembly protein TadG-related protein [Caulobacteraceae bacterium]|jgi:hypothetical protein
MPPRAACSPKRTVRVWLVDDRGGLAVIMAGSVGVLAILAAGGVEMADLFATRAKMRDAADSAALAGAAELTLSIPEGITSRAEARAMAQLAPLAQRVSLTPAAAVVDMPGGAKALKLRLEGRRPSFFGNLFPPGGFLVSVDSTAMNVAKATLCVLAHGDSKGLTVEAKDSSTIQAKTCLIHSNEDIAVTNSATVNAGYVQAVTKATGAITPSPRSGAKAIPDPFLSLPLTPPKCTGAATAQKWTSGTYVLSKGVHCAPIDAAGTAVVSLEKGEHWFVKSAFTIREDARLTGQDAVLFFDRDSKFEFKDRSRVSLEGRRTGLYAGFLIAATRTNDHDFFISSDHVDQLLGTIYIPNAKLVVTGKSKVAGESAWTVLVAKRLQLTGTPTLVINTNYDLGQVPVPAGVGPIAGSRLVR